MDGEGKSAEVRPVGRSAKELEALAALERRCFSCPWSAESFAGAMRYGKLFYLPGLYIDGVLAGYAVLFVLFEEADLQNLAVRPEDRGRGYGKLLLENCEEEARRRGAEVFRLEVRRGNAAARGLYEKDGFSVIGERKNYYREPVEDALLMEKKL